MKSKPKSSVKKNIPHQKTQKLSQSKKQKIEPLNEHALYSTLMAGLMQNSFVLYIPTTSSIYAMPLETFEQVGGTEMVMKLRSQSERGIFVELDTGDDGKIQGMEIVKPEKFYGKEVHSRSNQTSRSIARTAACSKGQKDPCKKAEGCGKEAGQIGAKSKTCGDSKAPKKVKKYIWE